MAWVGTHPIPGLSRTKAKALLPAAACRLSIYLFRVSARNLERTGGKCRRCGIDWDEIRPGLVAGLAELGIEQKGQSHG